MSHALPLEAFEKIDGLRRRLLYLQSNPSRMIAGGLVANPRQSAMERAPEIALSNRLFDACVDAGMPRDTPCHEAWADNAITAFLLSTGEA